MYMAYIAGWTPVITFDEDENKARAKAVRAKHDKCFDDLDVEDWTWENATEYYGGYSVKVDTEKEIWL